MGTRFNLFAAPGGGTVYPGVKAGLSGTFAPAYVAVVAGDGTTDDAPTINARMTTAATFGGGRVIIPAGATGTVVANTMLSIPSNVVLEISPWVTLQRGASLTGNLIQNKAVAAGGRDTNVGLVIGNGARIAAGNPGTTGYNAHALRFRHVDGLVVSGSNGGGTITSSAGKYAISLADVTRYTVDGITFAVSSDGVHVAGPASVGTIRNLYGTSGDDFVAVTPRDWTAYDDSSGDVTDLVIENLFGTSTAACVLKLLGGAATALTSLKRVRARNIFGAGNNNAVFIGDDTAQANTTGGLIDALTLENVSSTVPNGQSVIYLNGSNMRRIRINGVSFDNSSSTATGIIRCVPVSAATVPVLVIENVTVQATGSPVLVVDSNATVAHLLFDKIYIAGAGSGVAALEVKGVVTDLSMSGVYANFTSSYAVLLNSSATTATITRATLSDVHVVGASGGGIIAATLSTHILPNVELANVQASGTAWLVDLNTSTEIHLSGVTLKSPTQGIANLRASSVVTFAGDGTALAAGGQNIKVTSGGKAIVRALDIPPSTTAGGFPTIAAGAGAGTGPTVTVAGTDRAGTITVTPGTSPASGAQATVTFVGTWPQTPKVALTPTNAAAQAAGGYLSAKSTTAFTVASANAPGGAMTFDYVIAA